MFNNKKLITMKMRTRNFLLLLAISVGLPLCAQQQPEWLNVWQKDGTCVSFRLQDHPYSRLNGEKMILETTTESIEYSQADIRKLTFGDEITGIQSVADNGRTAVVVDRQIQITGAKPGTSVSIYGLNGAVLGRYKTDAEGRLAIPYPQRRAGVVLLTIGSVTYKMTTR